MDKIGMKLRAGVNEAYVSSGKDVTIDRDAVKTTGHEDHLVRKDLLELVHKVL